ncbi:MAG: ABC transporter substrate-binding protein [Planctomycetota bacterium]|nr:ABC transporter substrate-binding protein [Planctomycetota bacterium]
MRTRLLITLLALTTFGCSQRSDWTDKDTLVYGRGSDSRSLDPIAVSDGESIKVQSNMLERLARVDFDGAIQPCLATEWEPLGDGRHGLRFRIREGVTFHDNTPLDAQAVAFNLRRLLRSQSPYIDFYSTILPDKIQVVSNQVEIETSRPDANLLRHLAMFPAAIVSPQAVKTLGQDFGDRAIGTGPFRFESWEKDQRIVLSRNESYWGEKAGVSRIEFWRIQDNNSRIKKLVNGDLSYIDNPNPQDIETIENHPELDYQMRKPGQEISLLYMAMNTSRPPFDNALFRRAIAHAIDKKKIARLFQGIASVADQAVPPGIYGHSDNVQGIEYDQKKAKQLLEKSGIKQRSFTLAHMSNSRPYIRQPHEVARALREALRRIGLEIKIEKHEWGTYLPLVQGARHDLCLLGWTTDNGDADNFLTTFYSSSSAKVGSANNVSFYKNPRMDDLLNQQRNEIDPKKRQQILDSIYRYAAEQSPIVPLVYVSDMIAYHRTLKNVRFHPLGEKVLAPIRIDSSSETPN